MRQIDADTLLEKVAKIRPWEPYPSKYAQGIRYCMELVTIIIKDAPTIEPKREAGEWIEDGDEMRVICSKCGEPNDFISDFCPNCGADMRGE